jgi:hypothetical protein
MIVPPATSYVRHQANYTYIAFFQDERITGQYSSSSSSSSRSFSPSTQMAYKPGRFSPTHTHPAKRVSESITSTLPTSRRWTLVHRTQAVIGEAQALMDKLTGALPLGHPALLWIHERDHPEAE